MIKLLKFILLFSALLLSGLVSQSAQISVKAKLDSVNLLMGKMTTLHLEVSQPTNVKGDFPIFKQLRQNGVVPVCGDSVELRAPSRIDTVTENGFYKIAYDVPLQAFDSGYYRLPEIEFVAGADTARTNRLSLKVVPVVAEANTQINDYASTADPADASIFDFIPDWVIDFWWVILLILLAIAAFVYGLRRYRREGSLLPKKPEPTPYEAAVAGLRKLKEQKLWEQGMEREYYTDLTDILRKYLYGRFGINAMEMTSREILAAVSRKKEIADRRPAIRQILDMADFVKFAKVRPLPEDNVKSFDNALKFVEDTKPVPVSDENEEGNKDPECKNVKKSATSKSAKTAKPGKKGGER